MSLSKAVQIILISFLAVGTLLLSVLSIITRLFWSIKTSWNVSSREMMKEQKLQGGPEFLFFWAFGGFVASFFLFRILLEQLGVFL